jgi:hypothetical protein
MSTYSIPTAVVLALVFSFSSQAAEKARPAQEKQNQSKKVWTNEDMDQLRARGLISIVGQESVEPASQPQAQQPAATEPTFPIYASRLDDPSWYADQAADLQAELERRQAALREQQEAIAKAADRISQPGLALDKDNAGVTPEAGVEVLQAKVQETQSQLDELSDLARQHDIAPGVLRG